MWVSDTPSGVSSGSHSFKTNGTFNALMPGDIRASGPFRCTAACLSSGTHIGSFMDVSLVSLYYWIDGPLIFFFRLTGIPILNFYIGTFVLCLICVVIGELTISLAIRFNRRYIHELNEEMNRNERLSIMAYESGDEATYKALNKQATDAWGKRFFTMVAYSAGILWPIPFALGWMQTRFQDLEFPLAFPLSLAFPGSVGYMFAFIPLYILGRIVFKYLRPHLPYFRGVMASLNSESIEKSG